jgi:hypothetical protein
VYGQHVAIAVAGRPGTYELRLSTSSVSPVSNTTDVMIISSEPRAEGCCPASTAKRTHASRWPDRRSPRRPDRVAGSCPADSAHNDRASVSWLVEARTRSGRRLMRTSDPSASMVLKRGRRGLLNGVAALMVASACAACRPDPVTTGFGRRQTITFPGGSHVLAAHRRRRYRTRFDRSGGTYGGPQVAIGRGRVAAAAFLGEFGSGGYRPVDDTAGSAMAASPGPSRTDRATAWCR